MHVACVRVAGLREPANYDTSSRYTSADPKPWNKEMQSIHLFNPEFGNFVEALHNLDDAASFLKAAIASDVKPIDHARSEFERTLLLFEIELKTFRKRVE